MHLLIVEARGKDSGSSPSDSASSSGEYSCLRRAIVNALKDVDIKDALITYRSYDDLAEYIFEAESEFTDPDAIKRFDALDFIFFMGNPLILPWYPSARQVCSRPARQVVKLVRQCVLFAKCTFTCAFGAQVLAYVMANGAKELPVCNGRGRGGPLSDLEALLPPEPEDVEDVGFLDYQSGDVFMYEPSEGAWKPRANVGLTRRGLIGDNPTRPLPRRSGAAPSRLHETVVDINVSFLSHALLAGLPSGFVVRAPSRWRVNAEHVQRRVSSLVVLASSSSHGPMIFEDGNIVGVAFSIEEGYPSTKGLVANFIKSKHARLKTAGQLDQSCRPLLGMVSDKQAAKAAATAIPGSEILSLKRILPDFVPPKKPPRILSKKWRGSRRAILAHVREQRAEEHKPPSRPPATSSDIVAVFRERAKQAVTTKDFGKPANYFTHYSAKFAVKPLPNAGTALALAPTHEARLAAQRHKPISSEITSAATSRRGDLSDGHSFRTAASRPVSRCMSVNTFGGSGWTAPSFSSVTPKKGSPAPTIVTTGHPPDVTISSTRRESPLNQIVSVGKLKPRRVASASSLHATAASGAGGVTGIGTSAGAGAGAGGLHNGEAGVFGGLYSISPSPLSNPRRAAGGAGCRIGDPSRSDTVRSGWTEKSTRRSTARSTSRPEHFASLSGLGSPPEGSVRSHVLSPTGQTRSDAQWAASRRSSSRSRTRNGRLSAAYEALQLSEPEHFHQQAGARPASGSTSPSPSQGPSKSRVLIRAVDPKRPYSAHRKHQRLAFTLSLNSTASMSVSAGCPYVSPKSQERREERESRAKWVAGAFKPTGSKSAALERKVTPLNVGAGPWSPPSSLLR